MKTHTIAASTLLALGTVAQDVVVTQAISPECSQLSAENNCSLHILEYLSHVCVPETSDSSQTNPQYDPSAPCVANTAIVFQCLYGAHGLSFYNQVLSGSGSYGDSDSMTPLDNTTQRNCLCQSAWFDAAKGCTQCYEKHGLTSALQSFSGVPEAAGGIFDSSPSAIDAFSKSYCSDNPTATIDLGDALLLGLADAVNSVTETLPTTGTFTLTDTLGNRTDVSLYYTTPSGSYWSVAIPTGSPSVSSGQIVATGSMSAQAGSSSATSPSASATGKNGAAGLTSLSGGAVMALAGAVAML